MGGLIPAFVFKTRPYFGLGPPKGGALLKPELIVETVPDPTPKTGHLRLPTGVEEWTVLVAFTILVVMCVSAIFAVQIAPFEPGATDLSRRLSPPTYVLADNFLGTDGLGRDVFSRMLYGFRITVVVSVAAVFLGLLIGVPVGLISGYFGGWIGVVLMRLTDIALSIPALLFAITIVAMLSPSTFTVIIAVALYSWIGVARLVRSRVLSLKELLFVRGSRALGADSLHVVLRHILPNVLGTVITTALLELARVSVTEASLSFLGLGVQSPQVSLGLMVADTRKYLSVSWWGVAFPGLYLLLYVVCLNIVANYFQKRADPLIRDLK